jgi:hypothetical protein
MRTATRYDPDDALLSELRAPPPLEECRTAVEFWRRRLAGLPRHRFAARREARAMVTRWEARLRAAEEAALPAPVRWLRNRLRVAAAVGLPAPVQWARSPNRIVRRGLLVTALLVGAWLATLWLVVIATLLALFN